MPTSRERPAGKSHFLWWIVGGSVLVVGCFGVCLCAGFFFWWKSSAGDGPGFSRAAIDADNVENTRAWAADTVKRLKESSNSATEVSRVEKELKDALLGKKVRWTFPVEAVDEGEVKLDTFFGAAGEPFRGDDPKLKGKPTRRVYLRVYLAADKDNVKVGDEATEVQAKLLQKGSKWTVSRTVTEVSVEKGDDPWFFASAYSGVVDVLDAYCITIVLERK
jgi:hypothetical protein